MSKEITVALIGNPNTGKTSVFNALTGLNQKVGNYPGITVEKKVGVIKITRNVKAHILDLPGTYSLNTTSLDESIVVELLLNKKSKDYPDVAVVITDIENLKRNLLLYTQIKDLKIPTLLVINMADRMQSRGISLDIETLEKELKTKIALVSTRKNQGITDLKNLIADYSLLDTAPVMDIASIDPTYFATLQKNFPKEHSYKLWLAITQDVNFSPLEKPENSALEVQGLKTKSELKKMQHTETVRRYQFINNVLKKGYAKDPNAATGFGAKLDKILTHPLFGYLIFFVLLLLIFQTIFDWSSYPQDYIDELFAGWSEHLKNWLPPGVLTNLITEGILAGIGGVVIFIPQIAFLFLFISILEESGYMSRVVFLMDKLLRPFGLSGKSVVPMISGTACAIPAVMATRTIENWKERLITILVVPFTTCSARLPVYLILIALVIPQGTVLGISYQALTLMGLYLLGFVMAIFSAKVLDLFLKIKKEAFFMIEMPDYRLPLPKNVLITVIEKTKSFVFGAGKIILALSIILWFLGSNGWGNEFKNAEQIVSQRIQAEGLSTLNQQTIEDQLMLEKSQTPALEVALRRAELQALTIEQEINSYKLEHSYIGRLGKIIEPIVTPLGYDWKIGIAVLTSFAAREVFVGTLATIYSVGSEEQETIKNRMAKEKNREGKPLFNLATGVSLMLFYAFAMQCISTLAIVKRETNSWQWPIGQFVAMSLVAYIISGIAYQILS